MLKNIQVAKFDNDLNIIACHHVIPFDVSHGDGGYAVRAIEIYRIHKMEALLKQFEQLTGYVVPRSNCTAEEIHLLIEQGEKVCLEAEEKVAEIKNEIMLCDRDLGNAKRGVGEISRWSSGIKDAVIQANNSLERAHTKITEAHAVVAARKGLLGLLREPVEHMLANGEKGFKGKVLTRIPLEPLPAHTYRKGMYSEGLRSHICAWELMDELEGALRSIIQKCTPPTDKYALNRGGLDRALLAVEYYSVPGETWRNVMTVDEYINLMMGPKSYREYKQREMHASL
ncbi:hypothetical protein [Serratia marcescens]|uniref:hypothetical protein n=1 Tax=Serratia marcescens TaxID=615 RepID=UPI001377698C|nr:hypothetical protein [Serratia marcescens]MBH3210106.1 hypothetical protein [Serratia marcescens]NCI53813.1 hypothetical protein [Serratia marcescens]NDJ07851.1 hypothetical protein [Serratia marcescens]NDJ32051.1 hypothetical protein [Serratia marcescens]NDJ44831.1 hypothetical protein [Serratia marcescens]